MAEKMTEKMKQQVEDAAQSKAMDKAYSKESTKAKIGEGKFRMPSFPSVTPAQQKREAEEAQDARDMATEKTLMKYNGKNVFEPGPNLEDPESFVPRRLGTKPDLKKGGSIKAYAKGGSIRGGGCETKGKTKGRFV